MDFFIFVIIIVALMVFGDIVVKIGAPLASRVGDLMADMVEERRLRRSDDAPEGRLPGDALDDLEARLARIEDRLDFIEALRAPDRRPALRAGEQQNRSDG